jgi:hypothetical protein
MTDRRVRFLQELLEFVGLGGRLRREWISSAEAQRFVQVVNSFTESVRAMGPSPLAVFNERLRAMVPGPSQDHPSEVSLPMGVCGAGEAEARTPAHH